MSKKLLFLYQSEEETTVLYQWEEGPIVFFDNVILKIPFSMQCEQEAIVFVAAKRRRYCFCSSEKKKLFFVAVRRRNYYFSSSEKKKLLFSMQCEEETIVLYNSEEGTIVCSGNVIMKLLFCSREKNNLLF